MGKFRLFLTSAHRMIVAAGVLSLHVCINCTSEGGGGWRLGLKRDGVVF